MSSEASNLLSLVSKKHVKVAPERAFDAWTSASDLNKWWGKDDAKPGFAEVDLRVGGKYRLGMQGMDTTQVWVCTGEFLEIDRPRKVRYTWSWEHETLSGEPTVVTVEFVPVAGGTDVVLTHEGFAEEQQRNGHDKGWVGVLNAFAKYLG